MNLELLLVVLIAWACLSWYRQDIALAFFVVLVPVYQIRFTLVGIPSTLLELLLLIFVAVFFFKSWITKQHVSVPFPWLLLFFVCVGAIATVVSVDVRSGLGLFKAYIVEPVLLFVVAVHVLDSWRSIRRLEWALIALVSVVALVGLLQWGGALDIPEPYASETPARATSVFPFPTAVGKLLGPLVAWSAVFVLFASRVLKSGIRMRLAGYAIATILGSLVLIVSKNRGALLGIAIALFISLFFHAKKKYIIPFVLIACVAVLFFVPVVRTEIVQVLQGTDTSTDVRLVMWQGTWRLLQNHPFVGAGLGGFPTLYDEYRDASHVELFPNPDNLLLTIWVELGLLGLAAFAWLFAVWGRQIKKIVKTWQLSSRKTLVGVAALAFLVALFSHGLVDTPYFKNDLSVVFWVVFAVLTVIAKNRIEETS